MYEGVRNIRRVYLSGAMSYYFTAEQYNKAIDWRVKSEKYLYGHGFKVFNPTSYYSFSDKKHTKKSEIMRFELFCQLTKCDVLLVNLDDIDKSIGTSDEVLYAYLNNIPVIGYTEKDNVDWLHPWKYEQCMRIETGKDALENSLDYICMYLGED